jgi:hypothetical protein
MDYSMGFAMRYAIQSNVNSGTMPPWPPDPSYQPHAHERLLTSSEITLINDWVNNGAPEGNPADTPPPPVYTGAELINPADWTAQIPDYTSQASTGDDYRCFVISNPSSTDMFITGIEVVPGNSNIVHHVLIFKDPSTNPANQDAAEPGPGYTCFGATGSPNSVFIGGWAPGQDPVFFPTGMGVRLEANTNIVLQLHYPQGSAGQVDAATKVNFELSSDLSLREVSNDALLNYFTSLTNGPLFIPANTVQTFYSEFTVPANLSIISIYPHMHLLGQSIRSYAVTPGGTTIPLIDIPVWDFDWQGQYDFRQPIFLPAGTVIHGEATYDNTAANPHNPNDPPQDVSAGEATTDEMMLIFFSYLPYLAGDENIVIDDGSHPVEYCATLPVELTDFSGYNQGRVNRLFWETAMEEGNSYFEIEHSRDGVDFWPIGTVASQGDSQLSQNYAFTHDAPSVGKNYYRLKDVSVDGTVNYSHTLSIDYYPPNELALYPNPVKGMLYIDGGASELLQVRIMDVAGRTVRDLTLDGGQTRTEMDMSSLESGIYLAYIKTADQGEVVRKIVR